MTVITCLFIIHKKEIQKKRSIKSRRIDKRKRKILILMHIITLLLHYCTEICSSQKQYLSSKSGGFKLVEIELIILDALLLLSEKLILFERTINITSWYVSIQTVTTSLVVKRRVNFPSVLGRRMVLKIIYQQHNKKVSKQHSLQILQHLQA